MSKGVYHLLIHLPQDKVMQIGKLGSFHFRAGYYVYTGSALSGLEPRITRHLRREKRLHWHIDYLLQYGRVIDVITHQTTERLECHFNREILSLPNSEIPVKGFGSSDCSCLSHLIYFEEKPHIPHHSKDY
jgi:Uri superfamily endonuclease